MAHFSSVTSLAEARHQAREFFAANADADLAVVSVRFLISGLSAQIVDIAEDGRVTPVL